MSTSTSTTAHTKSAATHKPTSRNHEEGEVMSIQATQSVTPVSSSSSHAPVTTSTTTAATAPSTGALPLPPSVTVPSPPQGYEPTSGINFRGIVPWTAELVILPKVLQDLARFTSSYTNVLGGTAPPIAQVIQALAVGGDWSTARGAAAAWNAYCRDQEGSAWRLINAMMDRLRPAFALAVQGDASVATTYPSLAELLAVKKVNAQRGASTRQKNKQALAKGEPATHGGAGKARQKRAAKAALVASQAVASTAVPAAPVTPLAVTATPKPAGQ